jgi:hypothetical protein
MGYDACGIYGLEFRNGYFLLGHFYGVPIGEYLGCIDSGLFNAGHLFGASDGMRPLSLSHQVSTSLLLFAEE